MSERAAAAGKNGAPHEVELDGKVYTFQPVVTERVMLAVEQALYDRELKALKAQREALPEAAYVERLDKLRERYLNDEFQFENPANIERLKTKEGAVLLMCCMTGATPKEMLLLMLKRTAEVRNVLQTVLALSMPEGRQDDPKAEARVVSG